MLKYLDFDLSQGETGNPGPPGQPVSIRLLNTRVHHGFYVMNKKKQFIVIGWEQVSFSFFFNLYCSGYYARVSNFRSHVINK